MTHIHYTMNPRLGDLVSKRRWTTAAIWHDADAGYVWALNDKYYTGIQYVTRAERIIFKCS